MFETMKSLAGRSVMERAVLFANHVISAEPVAVERLRPHAMRTMLLEFIGWPALLPPLGPIAFRVTPAGLLEWLDAPGELPPDLRVAVDVPNPALALARMATGERPKVSVSGDAGFASDLNWLIENLRWDVQDDLARFVGDAPARELSKFAGAFADALREAAGTLRGFAKRNGGAAAEPPGP